MFEGEAIGTSNLLAAASQKCSILFLTSAIFLQVDRAISQRRFRGPVIGPIGAYLKIAPGKEKLAPLAELALGNGTLDRFIVTNDHDRKTFQVIRSEAGCRGDCGIFQVSRHPKYNIPPPPVDDIETVASALTISDDLVFNCLVDMCKIEERALSMSKKESERLLLRRDDKGQRIILGQIKNVVFLPDGDSWAIRNGHLQMTANEKRLRHTIGVDKSAAVADAEQKAQALQEDVKNLRQEESRYELKHLEYQKAWNEAKRESQQKDKDVSRLVAAIDEIKNKEVWAATFDTDTTEYEQEVQESQEEVQKLIEQEKELKDKISEKNPEIGEIKARLNEVRTRNEKVLRDISEAENELAEHIHNISQRQEKLEKKREKLKKYEAIIEKHNEKVNESQSDVDHNLDAARRLSFHRIQREERQAQEQEGGQPNDSQFTQDPTNEELEAIEICITEEVSSFYDAKIKRFKKKIQEEKERQNAEKDDPVVAYQKYRRAKDQLQNKTEQCQEIEAFSKMLDIDVKERKKRWTQFRDHITGLTDSKFDEIMNKKGSSGAIEFDHHEKQLSLIVQKDSRDTNSQQKDLKGLSGGERSYATIALLLALGESLETPFRVLDEFDVFLDPVARKQTIESLIHVAKGMQHRQFIFITPQDVSNVETDPMLKVLKMTPPARNEVAGGPTQQTLDFALQP
jgi:DNA repair exonuclease SbcCD ATPase subunit